MKDNIELYNLDVNKFIEKVIPKDSFTFFDPPYYHKGKSLYPEFFTQTDHIALRDTIEKCMECNPWIIT